MATTEYQHYVWITANDDSMTEEIAGRLVRRGWKVGPLGNSLSLRNDENIVAFIAMSLSKSSEEPIKVANVLDEVKDVLKILGTKYHSLLVTQATGCTWCLGNVTKTMLEKEREEELRTVN